MHVVDTFAYLVQKKRQKYRKRESRLLNSPKAIYYHMKLLTSDIHCPRTLLHNGPTSPTPTPIPLPVRGAIVLRTAGNILPCGIEATTSASEEAFLLLFLEIRIKLVRVEFGSAEQGCNEDDEVNTWQLTVSKGYLRRTGVKGDLPRNTNCAQKSTTPKNGKFTVTRFIKVLTTLGVQTSFATGFSASSVQCLMALR